MNAAEVTRFIAKYFNPQWAINMDGGGSTTLTVKGLGHPETNVVNYPTDGGTHDHTGERSERGQATASAGTEGGENLELSPSQKTSVRYQYESYCKKVIRGERCDYLREVLRRAEKEVCFSDLPEGILMQMGISDDYPVEHYVFEIRGHRISITDERLGEALLRVDADGRDLLLLAYCLDLSDREIGLLLGTPRSTIQRRRQRFLDQMKQLLKE